MVKVHVVGHRRRLDATIATLQGLRMIHLIDVTEDPSVRLPPMAVDEDHLRELEQVRFLRARLEAVLALAPPAVSSVIRGGPADVDFSEVGRRIEEVGPEIEELVRRRDELNKEAETLPRHLDALRRLLPLVSGLGDVGTYDTMAVTLDSRHAPLLGELSAQLNDALTGNFEIVSDRIAPGTVGAVIVFPDHARNAVESIIGGQQVSRVRLPRRYEGVSLGEAVVDMELRLTELPGEIEAIGARVAEVVGGHPDWPRAVVALAARQEQLQAMRRLGATPHTFVVSGWIPEARLDELSRELARGVGTDVMVARAETGPDELGPVQLVNPAIVASFDSLVRLLGLPRYGTLDPTALMALFLPFFFGVMLGDVAYGVILALASWAVGHRFGSRSKTVADFVRIFRLSSAWAIAWGIVYGELLGDLGHRLLGMEPLWINREEALEPLLVFALVIGAIHVVLGLVLGIWQARITRDGHRLVDRLGHLVALIGLFGIAGTFAGFVPDATMTPAVAAVVVGLVILMAAGGPMGVLLGPIELMGTIGNVLSYLRLAAIGLASVYLARVANELGTLGPLWLGVSVAALLHALNLALGAFSPTIQALRLNYVEFFQKFYTEGGVAFQPFGHVGGAGSITVMAAPTREE
jgi:V/A-type H+/Na+-transporting ATPase subunit I